MPIIASQHKWKDKEHVPSADWPEDCLVQWGGRGVVLLEAPGKSYGTAFFEAFPKSGGFIRGEGPTITEAEAKALEKFRRESACTHLWGRDRWTNGGAICRKCKAFQTVFAPIVKLGAWKDPLTATELDFIASGYLRREKGDNPRYLRRIALKAAAAGILLPEPPAAGEEAPGLFDPPDAYILACRRAVRARLAELLPPREEATADLTRLFDRMHRRSLERLMEDLEEEEGPSPSL